MIETLFATPQTIGMVTQKNPTLNSDLKISGQIFRTAKY